LRRASIPAKVLITLLVTPLLLVAPGTLPHGDSEAPALGARALFSDALNVSLASLLGVGIIMATWFLLTKLMPISLTKAIGKDRNPAVAVLLFSVFVGLGIILQSALFAHAPAQAAPSLGP
jgi:hypothetical protein